MKSKAIAVAVMGACLAPGLAGATDGYFSHGYGMKSKGMAGATTAYTGDTFGGATNPATMVWVGNRFDLGIDLFSPDRDAARTGSPAATVGLDGSVTSGDTMFFIPEFGYNKMLSPDLSLGVTVYGNGGMNTNYPGGQITSAAGTGTCNFFQTGGLGTPKASYNMLCGDGNLGVDLSQLIFAPTLSWKMMPNQSIGISPLLGYQRFKAEGLQGFAGFSTDASKLTNNGYDTATGWGVRFGWLGKLSDSVSIGAAYSTKIAMSKFSKYAGLFAEQGGFDMPANWSIGASFKAAPKLTVLADYKQINYSGVKSVGNSSTFAVAGNPGIPNSLGGTDGRGFGWQDVNVIKLGLEYQWSDALTVRGGYGKSKNPIRSADVTFNILAPGVVQDHWTAGFTYSVASDSDITMAAMYAPRKSVTGASLFDQFMGAGAGGTETISMSEYSVGVAWQKRY
ncbi:MAG: outer membrane protein transport protein [Burkholderiales bacterium]